MSDDLKIVLFGIGLGLFMGAIVTYSTMITLDYNQQRINCESKGGQVVRSMSGNYICAKLEILK